MAKNMKPAALVQSNSMATKRKKKIIFGITQATWGGAQRYVFDLATNLPSERFEIVVMGGAPGLLKDKVEAAGMRFIEIENLKRNISITKELGAWWQILRIIKREKPHILHLNSPKMAGLGALAGRITGVARIVVTVHGWSFSERRLFIYTWLIALFSWISALLAHYTIIITAEDLKNIKRFPFMSQERYRLIHNGVNPPAASGSLNEARQELKNIVEERRGEDIPMLNEPIWIGTIAELTPNKDLKTLVRAAASLPLAIPVVIIGDGEEKDSLEKLIKELKADNRIFFAGFIPQAARLLPALTIFVLSSAKEGLPYVLLEAGQYGLPVISTRVGGAPDIIEDGVSGILINPRSPGELQDAIMHLAGDVAKRKRLGAVLQKKIASHFQMNSMVQKTLAVYG